MSNLRSTALRIASELPPADPTRLKLLAALTQHDVKTAENSKMVDDVLHALKMLSHHKIRPQVEQDKDGATISFNAPGSLAAAYVENLLDEQLGSRAKFDVVGTGHKVYIDLF